MLNTAYADGVDGITFKRRKKDAAKGVTNGNTKARLERAELKLSVVVVGLQHHNFIRFLKC